MTFNSIIKKLVKKNIKEYLLIILSIAFTVGLVTSLGIVIFSPSVSNVFYPGGTSQQFSYIMYIVMNLACIVFIFFVQSLFLRYKSKEIGVFMSLGVRKSFITKLLKKEMFYIIPLAAIIGIIFAIPTSYILWNALAFLFNNKETIFYIGWKGIIFGAVFSILAYYIMSIVTKLYIKKVDLIKILKTTSTVEKVNFGSPILGIIGIICIPLGTLGIIFRTMEGISLALCIIGIYLFSTQVATMGRIVNKIRKDIYFKNLVFFNLLKLKGKQFALSLFIGTILTAVGLYSLLFMVGPTVENIETLKHSVYDFGYIQFLESNELSKDKITELANKNNLNILNFKDLEGYFLVPYNLFPDLSKEWFWSEDVPFVSESSFNNFFDENIDVSPGKYIISTGYNMTTDDSNELLRHGMEIKFFNADKNKIHIQPEKTIELKNKMFVSEMFKHIRILDDIDYNKIKANVEDEFIFKYKVFNVDKPKQSIKFSNEFFNEYLKIHNYKFVKLVRYRGSMKIDGEKIVFENIKKLNPDYKRNWPLMPYSKIDRQKNSNSDAAVYFLVFVIIALSCIISGSFVIGIKMLNSMWEEKILFKNISFLGSKKSYIKSIINKQVRLLYLFPNILAAIIILSIYTSGVKSYMVYHNKVLLISYVIVLLIIFISLIISFVISKKIYKECIRFTKI